MCFLCISGYVDSKKRYIILRQFMTGHSHFAYMKKKFSSNVNQNCIVLYQSSTQWLLVDDRYSYTVRMCFVCILEYVDSKKLYNFDTFVYLTWSLLLVFENNIFIKHPGCIWLMFDISVKHQQYFCAIAF